MGFNGDKKSGEGTSKQPQMPQAQSSYHQMLQARREKLKQSQMPQSQSSYDQMLQAQYGPGLSSPSPYQEAFPQAGGTEAGPSVNQKSGRGKGKSKEPEMPQPRQRPALPPPKQQISPQARGNKAGPSDKNQKSVKGKSKQPQIPQPQPSDEESQSSEEESQSSEEAIQSSGEGSQSSDEEKPMPKGLKAKARKEKARKAKARKPKARKRPGHRTNRRGLCPKCGTTVERDMDGCNYMTCPPPCKFEFCLICAKKWKTCDHPWFNQSELDDTHGLPGISPVSSEAEEQSEGSEDFGAGPSAEWGQGFGAGLNVGAAASRQGLPNFGANWDNLPQLGGGGNWPDLSQITIPPLDVRNFSPARAYHPG